MCPDVHGFIVPSIPVENREQRFFVRVVETVTVNNEPVLPPGEW